MTAAAPARRLALTGDELAAIVEQHAAALHADRRRVRRRAAVIAAVIVAAIAATAAGVTAAVIDRAPLGSGWSLSGSSAVTTSAHQTFTRTNGAVHTIGTDEGGWGITVDSNLTMDAATTAQVTDTNGGTDWQTYWDCHLRPDPSKTSNANTHDCESAYTIGTDRAFAVYLIRNGTNVAGNANTVSFTPQLVLD